jgi:hypothetical protein
MMLKIFLTMECPNDAGISMISFSSPSLFMKKFQTRYTGALWYQHGDAGFNLLSGDLYTSLVPSYLSSDLTLE